MMMVQWQYTSQSGVQTVKGFHLDNTMLLIIILNFCAELTEFLRQLDTRADTAIKESKKHSAERKERVLSDPLDSSPPQGAPSWTISKDWLKGITTSPYDVIYN